MNPLDELIRHYADRLKTQPDLDPLRRDPAPPEPGAGDVAGPSKSQPTLATAPVGPPSADAAAAGIDAAADRRDRPAEPAPHPAGPAPRPPSTHADLEEMAQVDPQGAALHRQWRDMDQLQKAAVFNEYYRKMRPLKGLPDAEIERELTPLERTFVFPHRPERNLPEFYGKKSPGKDPVAPPPGTSTPPTSSGGADETRPRVDDDSTKRGGSSSPSGRPLARRPPPERIKEIVPGTRRRRGPVE